MKQLSIYLNKSILILLFGLLTITCFAFIPGSSISPATTKTLWLWVVVAFLSVYILLYGILTPGKKGIAFTLPDALMLIFFSYILIRSLLTREIKVNLNSLLILFFLVVLYILLRWLFGSGQKKSQAWNSRMFFLLLLLSGIGQAIYGLLQLYDFLPSFHGRFSITGTFFNPGPYSGYIAVIAVMGLAAWLFTSPKDLLDRIIQYTGITTVFLILLVLPAAKSRAAWLAMAGGTFLLLWIKYDIGGYIKSILNTLWKVVVALIMLLCLIAFSGYGLYRLKSGSVQGRLLIWKITSQMVSDHPITGVGYNQFDAEFGNYQAAYFKAGNASQWEKQVAGYEQYAFNEYLQIAGETGLIGLLLFLGLASALLTPFFRRTKQMKQGFHGFMPLASASGLMGVLIFALFSYPFSIIPIKLAGVFSAAVLAGSYKTKFSMSFGRCGFLSLMILFAAGLIKLVPYIQKQHHAYSKWQKAYTQYRYGNYEMAAEIYEEAFEILKYNGGYLTNYGKALAMSSQWKNGLLVLKKAQNYQSGPVIYTTMGDCHKALKDFKKAEQAYLHAAQIIPNRFYPLTCWPGCTRNPTSLKKPFK